MSISTVFITRPVATTLLTIGIALAGIGAFFLLPVSPLPNVDYPTISVTAQLPGASPETVATSVATPLERHLGAIADVTEMTSQSSVGSTRITLQFGLDRDIDGAARDVQAAINAARVDLPAALRSNPTYRKVNPASAPVLILALSSATMSDGQIYDAASTVMEQKLSQVDGVGEVDIGGGALPAVRVELNPTALFKYGIGLEDIRAALAAANANAPKGAVTQDGRRYQIYVNDTATVAAQFKNLIVAYRNNAPVRLADLGHVIDSVENIRSQGLAGSKSSVLVVVYRQPGANIINVVDRIKSIIPELQASIPNAISITPTNDRTTSIRASLRDMEHTMLIAVCLVVLVVFLFLRNGRAALVPSIAVPLSLLGTFAAMYLFGFSLDNLSLMALTVATGFVVDDAIVVLENISRHVEQGMPPVKAAILGAGEVGFTVLSMSVSLIAVFTPILLMGGIIGRLFHEFAVTLSIAIVFSLVFSLTLTPMMCAHLKLDKPLGRQNMVMRASERAFTQGLHFYQRTLRWALANPLLIMALLCAAVILNVGLFHHIKKGFFPQQDNGIMIGRIRADQSISFQLMQQKFIQFQDILSGQPYVAQVVGFTGGGNGATNTGSVFITLKPLGQRPSMQHVIADLRIKLSKIAGARLFLNPVQDLRIGARQANATYQYTIQSDQLSDLETWAPKITAALQNVPELEDVNSDRQQSGLDIELKIDRDTAQRLGVNATQIDNTLYDAFGQRQVSTIYENLNQYHVVMEVAPRYWQSPETLKDIYVSTAGNITGTEATGAVAGTTAIAGVAAENASEVAADAVRNQAQNAIAQTTRGAASTGSSVSTSVETMVPLVAFSHFGPGTTPISINHQGPFVATTFSFNLPAGESLGTAVNAIQRTMDGLHVPNSVHGAFAGNALAFQRSLRDEGVLIAAAIATIYIVLGVLYESYIHPITILSTLPSASVGALLALMMFGGEFDLIGFVGIILLIGIVKKNAIMMIDFALTAQRTQDISAREAIYQACLLRFRPIMMTTMSAMLAALPLAIITGNGAELRQPLGISIFGGLLICQVLTLYTTPVIYVYLDRFGASYREFRQRSYINLKAQFARKISAWSQMKP